MQGFNGEDQRIEFFGVPQFGEIQSDRSGGEDRSVQRLFHQTLKALSGDSGRQRALFDRMAPASVGVPVDFQPPDPARLHRSGRGEFPLIQRAQRLQNAHGSIDRIGGVGPVLTAEPERNPRSVRLLLRLQIPQAAPDQTVCFFLKTGRHAVSPGCAGADGVRG